MTNETEPIQPVVHRLSNPYNLKHKQGTRVQMDIASDDFNYLFRGILAGIHGAQASVVGTLLKKFINAVRNEQPEIPAHWGDDHPERIAAILARCNFAPELAGRPVKGPARRTSTRNDGGTSKRVRSSVQGAKNKSTDDGSKANGGVGHNPEKATEEENG